MRLKDMVAIVTGSTSGMGRDTAYLMAEEGAKVVVTGRREERLKEVVENIKNDGGEAMYVRADMANLDDVENIYNQTIEKYGRVDILYNNAGVITYESTLDISIEEWNNVFAVNVTAPLVLSRLCGKKMKEQGKGSIIITSSIAGTAAKWGPSAYAASKHGVNGLTKALARDLGPEVRVNAILPGAIETEMLDSAGGAEGDSVAPMKDMSPLGRVGSGREIGEVAIFLGTDQSSFITGQLIRVDGGVDC